LTILTILTILTQNNNTGEHHRAEELKKNISRGFLKTFFWFFI